MLGSRVHRNTSKSCFLLAYSGLTLICLQSCTRCSRTECDEYEILIRTNIRIYSYWKKQYERMSEYIRIKKRIRIWYERIFVAENIRIYSNIRIFNTLWYEKYDTNEYPNIFGSKKWYERIYEYIRIKKRIRIWYERIFVAENIRIYSNIRIFVTLWKKTLADFKRESYFLLFFWRKCLQTKRGNPK